MTRRSGAQPSGTQPAPPEATAPPEASLLDVFERIRRRVRPTTRLDPPDVPPDEARESRRQPATAESRAAPERPGEAGRTTMQVEGERILLTTPEGQRYALDLEKLFEEVGAQRRERPDVVWPRGTRAVRGGSGGFVIAHETPPAVHRLRWAAPGSGRDRGRDTRYREVQLALPYLVLVTTFRLDAPGALHWRGWVEAYFSNEPLRSMAAPLHYAPLLNVCRWPESNGSAVCMQGFTHAPAPDERDPSARLHRGLAAIVGYFLQSGFNEDFERVGRGSSFNDPLAKPDDPRLATVEAWEEASARDPGFVLSIPWIPVGRTLDQVMESVGGELGTRRAPARNGALQRVILKHGSRERESAPPEVRAAPTPGSTSARSAPPPPLEARP